MIKAAGLFQAFTRNMAYGVKALIDQRIEAGEAPAGPGRRARRTESAPRKRSGDRRRRRRSRERSEPEHGRRRRGRDSAKTE